MKRLARAAVIAKLIDLLESNGSWCGETHLQKAVYVLQAACKVPLEFDYILYKHGPFSFDLRSELDELKADGFIEVQPQGYPYGPRLVGTRLSSELEERFPKTLRLYGPKIDAVARFIGAKNVSQLERLATALMLMEDKPALNDDEIAHELNEIKPHVSESSARAAAQKVRSFLAKVD